MRVVAAERNRVGNARPGVLDPQDQGLEIQQATTDSCSKSSACAMPCTSPSTTKTLNEPPIGPGGPLSRRLA
jgi:hypothetical protein